MTYKIEARTRKQIAEFLPNAIRVSIASYRVFSGKEKSNNPKDFKEHHGACKTAIAHIELLLKLAKLADLPDEQFDNQNNHNVLLDLIESAQGELGGSPP